MEESLKLEFANYLSFFGILNKATSRTFLNQIDSLSKLSNISFFQILSQSLSLFLSKLTLDDFSQIALNIVLRYSRNKMQDYLLPLQKALRANNKKNMTVVKRKLIKWRHIIYELKKKGPSTQPSQQSKGLNLTPVPVPSSSTIFKAKSNQCNSSFRSAKLDGSLSASASASPFQCNYDFEPSQNTSKNTIMRIMNANRMNNTSEYCSTHSQYDTQFLQRQNTFLLTKEKTKERVKREIEAETKNECTFSPKINNKTKSYVNKRKLKRNNSTFNRLYIDNFERQNKKNVKELEYIEMIKTEANQYNNKTQHDQKKIDELYEEYKLKEKKKRELFEKINNEQRFPFAPCTNNANNTNSNAKAKKNKQRNLSFDDTSNLRAQDKENLNYVLEYIKYKEGK